MTEPTLLSRFQGCLMGVRLGDAMGMPWETMTRKQILKKTDGRGVTGFVDPQQRHSPDTAHFKAGDTTDDWQLTEAVAESLIRRRGLVLEDMARAHVDAYEHSVAGWGGTTKKAMQEFKLWFESNGARGRAPGEPSTIFSRGNGVAMKIAPVALLTSQSGESGLELESATLRLSEMTHRDPLAWITAFGLARIVQLIVLDQYIDQVVGEVISYEDQYAQGRFVQNTFSCRLEDFFKPSLKSASIEDVLLVTGCGFDAVESVSVAIACAMRHLDDPRAGLLEAINCGGDTDTVASMCGAILGARNGIEGWPEEWRSFRAEYISTLSLSERLLEAAQSNIT